MLTKTGRGSAPSFIINKFLGLTEIDRLKAPVPLFPTRFMSTERILSARSLPDIDLNTEDASAFIQATKDLLGEENCAWLVSFKPLQRASAFRLYCKSIDMKIKEYDEVAKDLDRYVDNKKWNYIIEEYVNFIKNKEEREKIRLQKDEEQRSTLLPMISTYLNHPGTKYKKQELYDVGIYEFMDSIKEFCYKYIVWTRL